MSTILMTKSDFKPSKYSRFVVYGSGKIDSGYSSFQALINTYFKERTVVYGRNSTTSKYEYVGIYE